MECGRALMPGPWSLFLRDENDIGRDEGKWKHMGKVCQGPLNGGVCLVAFSSTGADMPGFNRSLGDVTGIDSVTLKVRKTKGFLGRVKRLIFHVYSRQYTIQSNLDFQQFSGLRGGPRFKEQTIQFLYQFVNMYVVPHRLIMRACKLWRDIFFAKANVLLLPLQATQLFIWLNKKCFILLYSDMFPIAAHDVIEKVWDIRSSYLKVSLSRGRSTNLSGLGCLFVSCFLILRIMWVSRNLNTWISNHIKSIQLHIAHSSIDCGSTQGCEL